MPTDHSNLLDNMILLAGSACPRLAAQVAEHLKAKLGDVKLQRFSDGENYVELKENVRGKSVYVLQSISPPANEHLMEMLLLADACRRSSAAEMVAVVPYLGYSRQDRRPRSIRAPISARVVADMLTTVGYSRLVTLDLHAEQIQGFYQIPVENIYGMPVLLGDIGASLDKTDGADGEGGRGTEAMIVAPDVGGVVRARAFATALNLDLAIIDKRRPQANIAKVMHIIGDVRGRSCFIVDDIVDTANTLCQAATALKEAGARRVAAYCTHAVLSGKAVTRISESDIDEMVICDTIAPRQEVQNCGKIRILTVSHLLAETVSRIYHHESIISLF